MTFPLSPRRKPEEGLKDRSNWQQNNSFQKLRALVVREQEIEMPTDKHDFVETSCSSEGSSIRDTSTLNLPPLEVDEEMGNVQSNLSETGGEEEEPEERRYGEFEGGGAAARTVYHQPLTDRDTV